MGMEVDMADDVLGGLDEVKVVSSSLLVVSRRKNVQRLGDLRGFNPRLLDAQDLLIADNNFVM